MNSNVFLINYIFSKLKQIVELLKPQKYFPT